MAQTRDGTALASHAEKAGTLPLNRAQSRHPRLIPSNIPRITPLIHPGWSASKSRAT